MATELCIWPTRGFGEPRESPTGLLQTTTHRHGLHFDHLHTRRRLSGAHVSRFVLHLMWYCPVGAQEVNFAGHLPNLYTNCHLKNAYDHVCFGAKQQEGTAGPCQHFGFGWRQWFIHSLIGPRAENTCISQSLTPNPNRASLLLSVGIPLLPMRIDHTETVCGHASPRKLSPPQGLLGDNVFQKLLSQARIIWAEGLRPTALFGIQYFILFVYWADAIAASGLFAVMKAMLLHGSICAAGSCDHSSSWSTWEGPQGTPLGLLHAARTAVSPSPSGSSFPSLALSKAKQNHCFTFFPCIPGSPFKSNKHRKERWLGKKKIRPTVLTPQIHCQVQIIHLCWSTLSPQNRRKHILTACWPPTPAAPTPPHFKVLLGAGAVLSV